MTLTKAQIDDALLIAEDETSWDRRDYEDSSRVLAAAYRAKCAEVEGLRKALEPFARMAEAIGESRPSIKHESDCVYGFEKAVLTLGDFHRAQKALEGKE